MMFESPRSRFIAGVVGQTAKAALTLTSTALLARWLGTERFGLFVFVVGSVASWRQLTDLGTSTTYFTLSAQTARSASFHHWYFVWIAAQGIITVSAVILAPEHLLATLLPGVSRSVAVLAVVSGFMQGSLWTAAWHGAEASRRTAEAQLVGVALAGAHLGLLYCLHALGQLSVPSLLAMIAAEWFLAALLVRRLRRATAQDFETLAGSLSSTFRLFRPLSAPLVPYAVFGAFAAFADRWMMQTWSGASVQGQFGAAQQFGAVTLLLTVAMVPVLWKEVAESSHAGDSVGATRRYDRASWAMFGASSIVAGFLMPWTSDILSFALGGDYLGGSAAFALMLWYPAHQSIGQLQGAYLYASGRVRTHVLTGSVALFCGVAGSYVVLAPRDALVPGLHLGATGLATRMLAVQFLAVLTNDCLIFGNRKGALRSTKQLFIIGTCLGLGWVSANLSRHCSSDAPTQAAVALAMYASIIGPLLVSIAPAIGFQRVSVRVLGKKAGSVLWTMIR